mgnify:CR=1 FL=1
MFEKKKSVWLFLLPGLAMLMIFYIVPFFSGIGYSLTDGSYKNTFVGLQNYRELWQNSILICEDISAGVVPMGADMRAWRQMNGLLCRYLSGEAARVSRLFCGLEERLK